MNLVAKVFIGDNDVYALGPGRVALLRATQKLGSLHKAAKSVGMSYRWAWGRIKDSETALGFDLLAKAPKRGQAKGLTDQGRELLEWYSALEKKIAAVLKEFPQPDFMPPDTKETNHKRPCLD